MTLVTGGRNYGYYFLLPFAAPCVGENILVSLRPPTNSPVTSKISHSGCHENTETFHVASVLVMAGQTNSGMYTACHLLDASWQMTTSDRLDQCFESANNVCLKLRKM